MDGTYRGFAIKKDFGMGYFEAFVSSQKGGDVYADNKSDEEYGAKLKFNFNEKFWLSATALIVDDAKTAATTGYTWTQNKPKTDGDTTGY